MKYYNKNLKEGVFSINDKECINFYNLEKQLIFTKIIYKNGDSSKIEYTYNKKGLKYNEKIFSLEKRLKTIVGFPLHCEVTEKDYEKNKTWVLKQDIFFEYDKNNNLIRKNDTLLKTEELYKYDKKNRITKLEILSEGTLETIDIYEYKKNSYKVERTNYLMYGEVDKFYTIYILDKNKNIIQEYSSTINKKEKFYLKSRYFYNEQNRLIKDVYILGDENTPALTHLYIYE